MAYLLKEKTIWFRTKKARRPPITKAIRRGVTAHRFTFAAGDHEAVDQIGDEATGVEGSGLSLNCNILTRTGL